MVVLPEPVPPDTKMLSRASTQARRKSNISGVAVPNPIRSSTVIGRAGNFRTVMTGPTSDSGSMTALTREPSGRRASTRGLDLVDAAAERGDDPVDDPQDVLVVEEVRVDPLDLAAALDVEVVRAVDHDLGDRLVGEQRLERSEARDLADQLLDQALPLVAGDREALGGDDPVDDALDLGPGARPRP